MGKDGRRYVSEGGKMAVCNENMHIYDCTKRKEKKNVYSNIVTVIEPLNQLCKITKLIIIAVHERGER